VGVSIESFPYCHGKLSTKRTFGKLILVDPFGEMEVLEGLRGISTACDRQELPAALVNMAQDALHNCQSGPKIQRPNTPESFLPVVSPAWEAAADLQDGTYGGAAFNGAMAVGDALPVGAIVKGTRAAETNPPTPAPTTIFSPLNCG
jgi:hypothetical protein